MATRKKAAIKRLSKEKDVVDKARTDKFRRSSTPKGKALDFISGKGKLSSTIKGDTAKKEGNKAAKTRRKRFIESNESKKKK